MAARWWHWYISEDKKKEIELNLIDEKEYKQGPQHAYWKGGSTESLKKCPPPWLGDQKNFEICKL